MILPAQVVVFGSIMQDLTFACAAFPRAGQTIAGRLTVGQGGKGSNQAIAAGRAGAATQFVGAVGDDSFPQTVRAFYDREGIGCTLQPKTGRATGTAVILLDASAQNQIVIEPGANAELALADIPDGTIESSRIVVVQLESSFAATAQVLRLARRSGVTTLLNPAPMPEGFDRSVLKNVDILVPNESEFAALIGLDDTAAADGSFVDVGRLPDNELHRLARTLGVPAVIITLGARGCFVSQVDDFYTVAAYNDIQVVDTTGAGDAFCGGLAAGFVKSNGNLRLAVRFGNAVAALSVTKLGAAHAMPHREELQEFLRGDPELLPLLQAGVETYI